MRIVFACVAAASFAVAPARALPPKAAPTPSLRDFVVGGEAAPAAPRPNGAAGEALYPHIYQAPLFGALFAVSANQTAVDESALRYYASLHNFARANAEIRRLKALHPNWTPPTNIYASAGAGADEQPFWDLLAADRLEELKAGIALKERSTQGWKPSRDLMTKIARKSAIVELVKKTDEHKPAEALAVADADPSILHCAYMDADWRVADAFLAVGLPKRAFEIYHAIIATCPDHDERLATVRKSISRFSFDQTRSLIAMGAKSADGATEFDAARLDLTRAEIAALNQGKNSQPIAPPALADFFAEVGRSHAPADLALAGWFEYNLGHFDKAEHWFSLASLSSPRAADSTEINLAEGHALSLLKLGHAEQALALAYRWRDVSKTMRQTYVGASAELLTRVSPPPRISDSGLADFAAVVEADRAFGGAQAIGWYRYNRGEWDDAVNWFHTALLWKGVDPNAGPGPGEVAAETASAIEGYGRALASAGRLDDASAVADLWRGGGPALEAVFVSLMSSAIDAAPAVSALKADQLAHFADAATLRKNVASASGLGWLRYRSADYAGAVGWFRKAIAWGQGKPDLASSQGLALALKQTGELAAAEDVAWGFSRDSADMRAIYVSAVVAELSADKASLPARRLDRFVGLVRADRSAAGAQALGWYRLKEGNCVYAAPWFRKAAAWSAASDEDIETARGLTLSLKAVGALGQAEDLAYAWRERDPTLSALYADIGVEELTSAAPVYPMSEARVRRFSERVLSERDVKGARALGWRRYGEAACGYGGQWLKLAASWGDADKRDEKTDEGLALTLRATGRLAEAARLALPWAAQSPAMKKLYIDAMAEEMSRDNPPEPIDEARLTAFAETIAASKSPLGAQALGWYRLERREFPEAARWFKNALDGWPAQRAGGSQRAADAGEGYTPILAKLALTREDYRRTPLAYSSTAAVAADGAAYVDTFEGLAKTEEGYALTLRGLGRAGEAEAIAWSWRDRWPALNDLFLSLAVDALNRADGPDISPERMSRYAAAIEDARSAPAATALGWRRLRAHEQDAAAAWFDKALRWSARAPDPGLIEGYVAALQAGRKFAEANKLAERWRGVSPRFDVIYLRSELEALRATGGADPASAAKYAGLEAEIAKARSGDGALSVGWLAYQNKDFAHALDWFRDALAWGGDAAKAKEGVALSLSALKRYEELAAFGYAERATPAVRDVYYGGMVAWLTADKPVLEVNPAARQKFEDAVVSDHNAIGAQALGWGAELRGQWPAARRWFDSAIAWSAFDPLTAPRNPDATRLKLVEGYVRALRGAGAADTAEDVAYVWRDAAPSLAGLYLETFTQAVADDGAAKAPQRLARFAAFAEKNRSAAGAGALGWRFYRAHANGDAIVWFERALAWAPEGPPPKKIAEGYVLSLRAAGRLEDAETFAYSLAKDPDMRALYIAAVVAELADPKTALAGPRIERFVATVSAARSAQGARALGWRRLAGDNCVYAAPWFRKAAAWSADSGDDLDTARGLALSLRKAGAFAEAENLAYAWRDRSPDMGKLFIGAGVAALESVAPRLSISPARLSRLSQRVLAERSVEGARALGWRRYGEAACGYGGQWFRLARAWGGKDDAKTDEGYGLTLRAVGRLGDAAALAYRWATEEPAMKKLYVDVMVEALSRDNPPQPLDEAQLKDFAAVIEPMRSALGAQALGWYRLQRRELDDSARWFKLALDWWPAGRPGPSQRLSPPAGDYAPILAKLALDGKDYRRTPLAFAHSWALVGQSAQDYDNSAIGLAKTEEGYAQTLRALGRLDEAEAIAWEWRDRWPALSALFLDIAAAELDRRDGPAIAPQRLQRYLAAIEADRSAGGAAAMAWRQYRLSAFDNSADWFQKALSWSKADAPPQSLIEGYVLALQGAKKFAAAEAVAAKWRAASPELNLVYIRSELQRLRTAGQAGRIAPSQFAEIEKTMSGAKSADGALSLAWVAYEAHDYAHALQWFQNAQTWGAGAIKAKEGVALSLSALQRYDDLAAFAFPERKASPALHDAYFGGMVAWLTSDKPLRAVKPEARSQFEQAVGEERSVVGAQALAWGGLMRGDAALSLKWFETAIAWNGFDPLAPQGAPDVAEAKLIEGYVQALRAGGDLARAEDLGFLWRDASASLGGLYLQIVTQELALDSAGLSEARVARFAALAEARRSPQAAGALAWRAYRAPALGEAISWFGKAIDWSPGHDGDAKIDEGMALALRAAGRLVEAEDFAWAHRAKSPELRAAYVAAFSDQLLNPKLAPNLSALRLARFGQIVAADKISSGAAALGWRRLQDGNCGYGVGWFRKAIAWSDHAHGQDKLYAGYAQALRAVGMFNEAEDAAFSYADRSPESRELYVNIVVEELTRQWPRVPMDEARVGRFAALVEKDRSAKGAQALGWRRYMQAGCGYGGRWFELAAAWSPDKRGDAHLNEGYGLSLRAVGRLARAEAVAWPWIERAPAMKKLYIDIAVEELSRDNPPEPIPEDRAAAFEATFASVHSALGAQALGWYRFARGEYEPAAHGFQNALDWWPQLEGGGQKLAAPVDDYRALLARLALRPEDYRRTPRAYPNSSLQTGRDTESYVKTEVGLAKTVEGYVRALSALSRYDEAETLGFRWLDRWPPLRQVLIDMAAAELSGASELSADRLARFVKLIEDARSGTGAQSLGWRAYKAKDYASAAHWMKAAIDWRPANGKLGLDVARAYAYSLSNLKQYDQALTFLAAWRERIPDLQAVSVDVSLASLNGLDPNTPAADQRIAEIASQVSAAHSAAGAQALGWLAVGRKEFTGAEAWFRKAIEWAPAGADPDPKALEGYARALEGERRLNDFLRFTEEWSARQPALKPLYVQAAAQALAAAAAAGQDLPTDALARAGRAFAQARSANGAQALAWQRVSQRDWVAAAAWFQAARNWSKTPDPKAAEGLIIALRNLHRDDEAEALAYDGGQHDDALRALYLEIVADRLTRKPPSAPDENGMRRFADAVLAAKSGNGAQALGWYSYGVRQYPAAAAWFEKSLAFGPAESAALGLAMTYRKLGDRENYLKVVQTYGGAYAKVAELGGARGGVRERRAAAEDGEAPGPRLHATLSARSVAAAPASAGAGANITRGWKLLNQGRPSESAQAFETALDSASGAQRRDAAYGRSIALISAGDTGEAGRAASSAPLTERQRNDVGAQLLSRRAWDAYNADRYLEALSWLDRRVAFAPEPRDLMQLRAWCLQKLKRAEAAEAVQSQLDRQLAP